MKKAAILAMAFLVSIPLGLAAQSPDDTPGAPNSYYAASYARVTYVQGDVFVQRTAGLGTEKVEVNLALVQGDTLGTGAGQAEVDFGRRNFLRLAENTKVEFAVLPTEGDDHVKIHVLEGSAYLRVSSLSGEKAFEVHSPDMSCYVLDDGLYRINVVANGQTEVRVSEGSLEAAGEAGSVVVHARESLAAEDGRLLGEPAYSTTRNDAFDQWNASRDALFAQRSTTSRLPSQIDEYQEELDQNGQWTYEQPYGYVWSPYGVGDGWRPYMYGRWDWYPGLGWNWISSEPWGWSVYHYGRWQWRFGLGWYWIPHWDFGPAWVNWWWDNDYIGWCPLTWYNRPAVIWGGRFYDRYREPFYPHDNRAMNIIRRDRLQDSNLGHNMLRGGELGRLDRVSLQDRQPGFRPGVGRSTLQSPEVQRIFANHAGIRGEAKNFAPGGGVSASRLRQSDAGSPSRSMNGARSLDRNSVAPSRSQANGSAARPGQSSERSIRVYPGRSTSPASGQGSGARSAGARQGDSSARVSPSTRGAAPSPSAAPPRAVERSGGSASKPSGTEAKPAEKVRHYASAAGREAPSVSPRSSSASSGREFRPDASLYARTYPSRISAGAGSGSRTVREYSSSQPRQSYSTGSRSTTLPSTSPSRSYSQAPRYDARSYSYSRPSTSPSSGPNYSSGRSYGVPRSYSSPFQSRGSYSYSAPSRSNSSSGRSYAAPRSGGSSGRSYSAPRSSGSSGSHSSASSRSSSSSGHSSVRRKG
ncbi:MAG TPA: DUF6600 domain-containing protein [Terriglobales bacterium]|nr:DUF6600 domain-containing protein [Terriglobales bacterium]